MLPNWDNLQGASKGKIVTIKVGEMLQLSCNKGFLLDGERKSDLVVCIMVHNKPKLVAEKAKGLFGYKECQAGTYT